MFWHPKGAKGKKIDRPHFCFRPTQHGDRQEPGRARYVREQGPVGLPCHNPSPSARTASPCLFVFTARREWGAACLLVGTHPPFGWCVGLFWFSCLAVAERAASARRGGGGRGRGRGRGRSGTGASPRSTGGGGGGGGGSAGAGGGGRRGRGAVSSGTGRRQRSDVGCVRLTPFKMATLPVGLRAGDDSPGLGSHGVTHPSFSLHYCVCDCVCRRLSVPAGPL